MIPWFKHTCNLFEQPNVIKLRMAEGLRGFGIYVVLLEKLTGSNGVLTADYNELGFNIREDAGLIKKVVEDFDLFSCYTQDGIDYFSDEDLKSTCEHLKQKQESRRLAGLASAASRKAKKTAILGNSVAMPVTENEQVLTDTSTNVQQMLTDTSTNVQQMLTKSATDKIREDDIYTTTNSVSENFEKFITQMGLDINYQQSVIEHLSRHGHKDKTTADIKMLLLRFADNVRTNQEPLGNKNVADIRKWFRFWAVQELGATDITPKPKKKITNTDGREAERQRNIRTLQMQQAAAADEAQKDRVVASPDDAEVEFKFGKV